jgi:hypothetical protein
MFNHHELNVPFSAGMAKSSVITLFFLPSLRLVAERVDQHSAVGVGQVCGKKGQIKKAP